MLLIMLAGGPNCHLYMFDKIQKPVRRTAASTNAPS